MTFAEEGQLGHLTVYELKQLSWSTPHFSI